MKVNWNNAILIEYMVFKFVQELKFQIISIVYAKNLLILNAVIITAKNVEGRLVMINESKQVYALKD